MALLVFPSSALQALSLLVHFLGLAILTYCLSQRLALSTVSPLNGSRQLSWPRLCVILIFLDSWLFMFSSGILIFGVGMETTEGACSAAIVLCIAFYATSKIFIYLFLAEKVYIVWSPAMGARRFKSPIYLICFVTISIYTVIIALMVAGRIYFQRPGDGACVVGLKHFSSIPLLTFDLYINILFTALFLWPLLRIQVLNLRVKSVAMRTLMAASVALTTSTANLVILAVLNGQELGWICLGSCAGDVIVNALAIFWVTSGSGGHSTQSSAGGPIPVDLRFTQFSRGLDVPISDQAGRHTPFDHQSTSRSGTPNPCCPAILTSGPIHGIEHDASRRALSPSPPKSPSLLKPTAVLFRKGQATPEEHELDLQIRATMQYNAGHQMDSASDNKSSDSVGGVA